MSKLHIKKGDTVYVNAGEDKGKTGRVLKVLVKEGRAFVEVFIARDFLKGPLVWL